MCFSAEASFIASAVLVGTGALCLSKVQEPQHKIIAATPFLFGLQQFTEGVLWTYINDPEATLAPLIATYIFTIFGQILWPTWIPLGTMLIEPSPKTKLYLKILLTLGISISVFLLYNTIFYPIRAEVNDHHIQYIFDFPSKSFIESWSYLYLLPTIGAMLISSWSKVKLLGLVGLISFIVSKFFYFHYVFSVWCFFSAIMSLIIYFLIKDLNQARSKENYIPPS